MNIPSVRAELENDYNWRLDEIRFFRNVLSAVPTEASKDQYRRALVLLLYSHFEGFCKFALLIYRKAVNDESLKRRDVNISLATSSFYEEFREVANTNIKPVDFYFDLENDADLQRFGRQQKFIEALDDYWEKLADVPETVVDTESNLNPIVLRKNLFRLGFQPEVFAVHDGTINQLLHRRNNIAHGAERAGVTESAYSKLEASVFAIMNALMVLITTHLRECRYLKVPSVAASSSTNAPGSI